MPGISSATATVDYLELLTVQLKNQDPIDPVDQEGLINDLTQFSILEGIEEMNTSFEQMLKLQEISQGVGLVGKNVSYQDANSGEIRSGKVSDILTTSDAISLLVDGQQVNISNIIGVSDDQQQ
ncbi:MAG: flagellar hook capping FlgD N-terminal domain-containing protein [Pirellulaceae bacterium]